MQFQFNDGGRAKAGYIGSTRDCVARSLAIATGKPYQEIYDALAQGNSTQKLTKHKRRRIERDYAKKGLPFDTPEYKAYVKKHAKAKTAANGINVKRKWFVDYITSLGFTWVPTMLIGQGCKVHLTETELPMGTLIVTVSRHYTTVIDGVLHDTYDCSRDGKRCVYGYYIKK